jgi:hypothetical protein
MAYKQKANPFSRKSSSPLFNNHNTNAINVMLTDGKNVSTSIDNTNLNAQGETQSQVTNRAYENIQNRINEMNKFYNSFDDLSNMSQEEIDRFDTGESGARENISNAERNFVRVSDSINNVNKRTPLNYNSPLNDNHDWEETLAGGDERGGYNVGEWGEEERVVLPNGDIKFIQRRDLNRNDEGGDGGGAGGGEPGMENWAEWIKTPEGQAWREQQTLEDTRSRIVKKREPIRSVTTLDPETEITEVTGDEREFTPPNIAKKLTEDDMNRMRDQIEINKKQDERSKRKRRRKKFWGGIGDTLGDIGKGIGRGAEFVLGNTGRSIVDIATLPVDLARSVRPGCRSCRKGLLDSRTIGIGGGDRGLAQGLFNKWRR